MPNHDFNRCHRASHPSLEEKPIHYRHWSYVLLPDRAFHSSPKGPRAIPPPALERYGIEIVMIVHYYSEIIRYEIQRTRAAERGKGFGCGSMARHGAGSESDVVIFQFWIGRVRIDCGC